MTTVFRSSGRQWRTNLQQLGLAEAGVANDQHVDVAAQGNTALAVAALAHAAQQHQQNAQLCICTTEVNIAR